MRLRQLVPLVMLCGMVALAGWGAARLYDFGSSGIENGATGGRSATRGATPLIADAAGSVDASLASAMGSMAAVATSPLKLPEATVAPAVMFVDKAATADPDALETASVLASFSAAEAPVLDRDSRPPPETRV